MEKQKIEESKIMGILLDMENSDENLPILEKAMNFYCSNWDICAGFKHAIIETLKDQYDNHDGLEDSDNQEAVHQLSDILEKAK